MNGDLGANKEFIDEEIIKIICDAIFNVFNLKAQFENAESKLIELKLENEKDQGTYSMIVYSQDKSKIWCNQLIDQCIRGLAKLEKPYKYIITCVLQQNTGALLSTLASGHFEETDGAVSKTIAINDIFLCFTVFGLAI